MTTTTTGETLLRVQRKRRGEPQEVRVTLEPWGGSWSLHVRWHRRSTATNAWMPSSAGATFRVEDLSALADAVEQARQILASRGVAT